MSDLKLGGQPFFDRGIERITHTGPKPTIGLPERGDSAPSELGTRPQLETLLALPTLDDELETAIRPQLEHRELMAPGKFRQALDGSLQRLREAADQLTGGGDGKPGEAGDSGDAARILNRATRQLTEECKLRDLVQMYRSVLYQG